MEEDDIPLEGKQYSELVAIERGAVTSQPPLNTPASEEVRRPSLGELDRKGLGML
jgi:hypothetical protein